MKKLAYTAAAFALLVPSAAFAQGGDLGNLQDIINGLGNIVDVATPVVVGIALLAFFWGLARYIFSAGDDEKKKEGRNIMIWGVVALFVMIAVWGIVRFIGDALGVTPEQSPVVVPGVNR